MERTRTLDLSDTFTPPFTLAILGDTHLGGKQRLSQDLTAEIADKQPRLILHTGDIVSRAVLDQLAEIAPVYAVRGNRDLLEWTRLPAICQFQFGAIRLSLFHGQGNFLQYWRTKLRALRRETALFFEERNFPPESAPSQILVYGHTHYPRLELKNLRLILNPGAISVNRNGFGFPTPTYALMHWQADGAISVEILTKTTDWHVTCKRTVDRERLSAEGR